MKLLSRIAVFILITLLSKSLNAQTLRYVEYDAPDVLDPYSGTYNDANNRMCSFLFESLYRYDRSNNPQPVLASKASISDNTMNIRLRKDIKWSDGGEFCAQDVVSTVNFIRDNASNPTFKKRINIIKHVYPTGTYDLTVEFTTNVQEEMYRALTFKVLPCYKLDRGGLPFTSSNRPVTTGLFKFDYINAGAPQFLNRFFDGVGFRTISSVPVANTATQISFLRNDQTDLIPHFPMSREVPPNSILVPLTVHSFTSMIINFGNLILLDQRVRQAICYAIDRPALISTQFGNKFAKPISSCFPSWHPYNRNNDFDTLRQPFEYSKEKAEQLLNDAGYNLRDNNGYRKNNLGQRLAFNMIVQKEIFYMYENIFTEIENSLKYIGIQITTIDLDIKAFRERLQEHNFDLAYDIKKFLYPSDCRNLFLKDRTENYGGYNNTTLNSLYKELSGIVDVNLKGIKGQEIVRELRKDCPHIFLWEELWFAAINKRFSNNSEYITPISIFDDIKKWK